MSAGRSRECPIAITGRCGGNGGKTHRAGAIKRVGLRLNLCEPLRPLR